MRRRSFLTGLGAAGTTLAGARLLSPSARAAHAATLRGAAGLTRLRRWPARLQAHLARFDGARPVSRYALE